MEILEEIKRLSYSPVLASCVRKLRLRNFMRRAYARLCGVPRVLKFSLCGIEVSLLARTPLELRCIEATWFSEQEMLSAVLSKLKSGDVFLDVGSNLGMITVFAARAVGSRGMVFAFEPETTAHTRLLENIRLNNLDNVKVFTKGLSCSRGNRNLLLGDEDGVSQSSRISEADGRSKIIETVDYDWLVDSQQFPIPSVVKMDIEGHEFSALQGMRRALSKPSCVALFCEVHPADLPKGVTVEQVLELIGSLGFKDIVAKDRAAQLQVFAGKEHKEKPRWSSSSLVRSDL